MQQQLIHQREYGGVGRNSKRKNKHEHNRESWNAHQSAQSVRQSAKEGHEEWLSYRNLGSKRTMKSYKVRTHGLVRRTQQPRRIHAFFADSCIFPLPGNLELGCLFSN